MIDGPGSIGKTGGPVPPQNVGETSPTPEVPKIIVDAKNQLFDDLVHNFDINGINGKPSQWGKIQGDISQYYQALDDSGIDPGLKQTLKTTIMGLQQSLGTIKGYVDNHLSQIKDGTAPSFVNDGIHNEFEKSLGYIQNLGGDPVPESDEVHEPYYFFKPMIESKLTDLKNSVGGYDDAGDSHGNTITSLLNWAKDYNSASFIEVYDKTDASTYIDTAITNFKGATAQFKNFLNSVNYPYDESAFPVEGRDVSTPNPNAFDGALDQVSYVVNKVGDYSDEQIDQVWNQLNDKFGGFNDDGSGTGLLKKSYT